MLKRKWIFRAETHDDDFYLDAVGEEIDYSDAIPFIVDIETARKEADRRANLWEEKNKGILARITYESLGRVYQ